MCREGAAGWAINPGQRGGMPAQAASGHGSRVPSGDTPARVPMSSPRPAGCPQPQGECRLSCPAHAAPSCGATPGRTWQIRLLPVLGMPVAILWERREQEGGKGPPGQPDTEPGTGSQPGASKISEGFCMSKTTPSLLLRAAQRCPHLPPMPLPPGGAAAVWPLPHRALAGAGPNPCPAAVGNCHPLPCTRRARAVGQRCGGQPAGGSRRAGRPADPRLFVALMLNTQR